MPDAAWLRARLANLPTSHGVLDGGWDDPGPDEGALVEAAVLVGIVTGPVPGVLLTKRSANLRQHAGQVSFPGGRMDPEDASPEAAALREAHEEVGLDPSQAEILGRLPPYITGTGYRVTPVLALLPPDLTYIHAPTEVEEVFQFPLSVLLDPAAPQQGTAEFRGKLRHYWVWPHPAQNIWGATAAILVHLATILRGA